MVAEHGIYDHDLRKEIMEYNMMKLLALLQVKAGKFVIKESHGAT